MYDQTNMDITDDVFEVEKILDAKRKDGRLYFKVHWEGYGSEEDSWEPSDNLLSCQELIEKYWLERGKGILKKRGRKSERDPEGMMTTPLIKRKRGRPPKRLPVKPPTERMVENRRDEPNLASPDSDSTSGAGKKKRGRPPKKMDCEDDAASLSSTDYLLLDLDEIAPLGLTRQASKELALVSLRKKHESETFASPGSEIRSTAEDTISDVNHQTCHDSSEKANKHNETFSCTSLEKNHFEIIEISSPSTVDDGDCQSSSRDSKVPRKEYIVISSNSESDGETERSPVKATNMLRPARETDQKQSLVTAEGEKIKSKPDTGAGSLSEPKEFANVEVFNSSSISSFLLVEPSKTGVLHGEENEETQSFKELSLESTTKASEQQRIENSNQVKSSVFAGKTSPQLLLKMQKMSKSVMVSKEFSTFPSSCVSCSENEALVKQTNNENNLRKTAAVCLSLNKNFVNKQTNTADLASQKSMSTYEQNKDSDGIYSLAEKTASWKDPGQGENLARFQVNQMDKSHIDNQRAELKKPSEKKIKAKARKTGDRCIFKKPITNRTREGSYSSTNTSAARSSPGRNSDHFPGPMTDAQEKFMAPTTADLLPIQNKLISASLMDGDLIGSIIQDSRSEAHNSKASTEYHTTRESRSAHKAHDESDEFRHWNSGMEDISEGEDDLSDFEFDLDDYSPHSFFNDVEEINVPKRAPSPVVEPQEISSADLKQSIREGNDMMVRRVLAVPGFDLEAVDSVSGMTLLMLAAASGQDGVVRLLLRRGAKLNTGQRGNAMTSLMHASEQGFSETVQILLESGAYINQQQTAGETALMKACKKGHVDVVEVLLKHGVDTRVQSNFDHTAAQFALRSQHFEIHNMLLEHEKSLTSTLEGALAKCLGGAGTLRPPLLMPYRCVAPGEVEKVCFPFKCNLSKIPQGSRVVLFCVKADFSGDEVCLSFAGDNGVRSVLLNGTTQCPVVQGKRSVYLLGVQSESNELTVATYSVKSRLIVCVANVTTATDS